MDIEGPFDTPSALRYNRTVYERVIPSVVLGEALSSPGLFSRLRLCGRQPKEPSPPRRRSRDTLKVLTRPHGYVPRELFEQEESRDLQARRHFKSLRGNLLCVVDKEWLVIYIKRYHSLHLYLLTTSVSESGCTVSLELKDRQALPPGHKVYSLSVQRLFAFSVVNVASFNYLSRYTIENDALHLHQHIECLEGEHVTSMAPNAQSGDLLVISRPAEPRASTLQLIDEEGASQLHRQAHGLVLNAWCGNTCDSIFLNYGDAVTILDALSPKEQLVISARHSPFYCLFEGREAHLLGLADFSDLRVFDLRFPQAPVSSVNHSCSVPPDRYSPVEGGDACGLLFSTRPGGRPLFVRPPTLTAKADVANRLAFSVVQEVNFELFPDNSSAGLGAPFCLRSLFAESLLGVNTRMCGLAGLGVEGDVLLFSFEGNDTLTAHLLRDAQGDARPCVGEAALADPVRFGFKF